MTKKITHDDVLKYIYKETSTEETNNVENQLALNNLAMEFYVESMEIISRISELQLEPSMKCQDKILDYSGSFKFESIS
ncbi:MAG: hypothetical protein HC819_05165 [Cyclobacteriaceae bacterium]|nr:hypothetical protein [Cyclobacteriaceae bacterium]